MSNDFKVNAVSGDSENLPAPEIVAAEIRDKIFLYKSPYELLRKKEASYPV